MILSRRHRSGEFPLGAPQPPRRRTVGSASRVGRRFHLADRARFRGARLVGSRVLSPLVSLAVVVLASFVPRGNGGVSESYFEAQVTAPAAASPATASSQAAPAATPTNPSMPPSSFAPLVQEGKRLYELGRLAEAQAKLEEALKLSPNSAIVQHYLRLIAAAGPAPAAAPQGGAKEPLALPLVAPTTTAAAGEVTLRVHGEGKILLGRRELTLAEVGGELKRLKAERPAVAVRVDFATSDAARIQSSPCW